MKSFLLMFILLSCSTQLHEQIYHGRGAYIVGATSHQASGKKYMIVTQGVATSRAAKKMLEMGGNLVDAAVAASFTISVERPQSTGIAGGGFLIHSKAGKHRAFDFRERAPEKSFPEMYLDQSGNEITNLSRDGHLAVGVPGFVKGMWQIHQQMGKLTWAQVIQPAIDLAKVGFTVYPHLAQAITEREKILKDDTDLKRIFFSVEGTPKKVGDQIIQNELALTLMAIAKMGEQYFYQGPFARALVKTQKNHKALITMNDLKKYKVIEREVVEQNVFDHKIVSMPPPSSGGVHVIQILNILEALNWKYKVNDPKTIHAMASSMQLAFFDRARYMGDPDFSKIPTQHLISKEYGKKLASMINPTSVIQADELSQKMNKADYESSETTHLTLMSSDGEVISSTQTINGFFGAGVGVPGTGVILNNEMDDFASKIGASNMFGAVGGVPNLVKPFKTPLSSMSPTIVFKNNRPVMALGTPSGTKILTCVAQTIFNRIVLGLSPLDSVSMVRVHQQWKPDQLIIESPQFANHVLDELRKIGHHIVEKDLGCKIQYVEQHNDGLIGISDHRGEGSALGLSI